MSNVFRVALPNNDIRAHLDSMAVDSRYASPKIDTLASPAHVGLISLNWNSSTIALPDTTIKLLYYFPHNYNYTPTVFASYKFDNGANILKGTLPFQNGSLGIILMDADTKNINLKYYSTDAGAPASNIPPFIMQIRFYVMAEQGI